ncbi:MAG: dTMP kinase [Nitrososphaerota archaeon]|nr:dTMP kinase [Nitrososphaerota archaeon]
MSRALGTFVAIEGVDAVGKRTQTSRLKSSLQERGLSTRTLSFPAYETAIGKEIKRFLSGKLSYPPQVRAMLYAANRWEKKAELEDMLSTTDVVIVDRYLGSNYAYGISGGLELDWLMALESGLPTPDLTLVLDASPVELAPRRETKDAYERNLHFQAEARRAYIDLARKFGWTIVDANRGIDETAETVRVAVARALEAKGRTV